MADRGCSRHTRLGLALFLYLTFRRLPASASLEVAPKGTGSYGRPFYDISMDDGVACRELVLLELLEFKSHQNTVQETVTE